MTKEEICQTIGRDVVEYAELGRTCAALKAGLYFVARDLQEIAQDVDRYTEPAAEKLDKMPTPGKIRELLAAHAEAKAKRETLRSFLQNYGITD